MTQRGQHVHQFDGFFGRLCPQQADAQAHRRQAVLFGGTEAGIQRIDHLAQAAAPRLPVRRVEDQIAIARAAGSQPLTEAIGRLGQLLARAHQAACPVEEMQEIGQALELEQALARARHRLAELARPRFQQPGVEATFEMHVHLGLGQGAQALDGGTGVRQGRFSKATGSSVIVVKCQFSASSLKNLVPEAVICAARPVSVIW